MKKPYKYQKRVAKLVRAGKSVVLQAPTGAGKTFAASWPYIQSWAAGGKRVPKKCVYAVPMRVLANQFTHQTNELVYEEMRLKEPPVVRIQTGEQARDPEFTADLTFATIDQVLSSWLMHPYSLSKRKGNLNAGAFVGSYLVFDEFHLFPPDSMLPTTLQMLKMLRGVSPFMLMTATFSKPMLDELASQLGAVAVLLTEEELAEIPAQEKERSFYCMGRMGGMGQPLVMEGVPFVEQVLASHLGQEGEFQRSLVIFNQVERAQRFYQALRAELPDGVEVRLLHSRFRAADRQRIEDEVRREFGKEKEKYRLKSLIFVATQVVEVGLDVTCVALHTELAPASSVLQRAGRCARYAGEVGRVFVYPVENLMPYHEKEAKAQCEATWEWLSQHQGRHLNFEDEQALVNYVHTPTDERILAGLRAGSSAWDERVQALWGGKGNRGEAAGLVRNVRRQSLVVHSDPDQLLHRPFAAESFSLHPGTLQGKAKGWLEMGDELPWQLLRLVEDEGEDESEANRPIKYDWKIVRDQVELSSAPLVAVQPAFVGYHADMGLMLYAGRAGEAGTAYECEVPEVVKRAAMEKFYRLESYETHIRLVHDAFCERGLPWLLPAARRIERAQGWRAGLIVEAAYVVVWLHDVGKLAQKWQGWANRWQKAIKLPYGGEAALAHTDYDSTIEAHEKLERKMKRDRPPHAVESALAAIPYLLGVVEADINHPLVRAAFSAIARHHAPFSHQSPGYTLRSTSQEELIKTSDLLPKAVWARCDGLALDLVLDVARDLPPHFIERQLLVEVDDNVGMCCYMLLVRALRHADQLGTQRGAA